MTYEEIYKKGQTITVKGLNKTYTLTVISIRYSKTGRLSAQIDNGTDDLFWTSPCAPLKTIDNVDVRRKYAVYGDVSVSN